MHACLLSCKQEITFCLIFQLEIAQGIVIDDKPVLTINASYPDVPRQLENRLDFNQRDLVQHESEWSMGEVFEEHFYSNL